MLILASASKRRIDLLKDSGIKFEVVVSEVEEVIDESLKPDELTINLAKSKALDVLAKHPDALVIAADTIVTYNEEIFGKPNSTIDAYQMLSKLQGNTHEVYTGVAIVSKDIRDTFYKKASVTMKKLSDLQIKEYIETKEPMDKAGAYAIQGLGKALIEHFDGDFFAIMGLPLKEVLEKIALYSKE